MLAERLGIISDEVSPQFDEALDWIVARGLPWVEVRMVDGVNVAYLSDEQVAAATAAIARRGLRVSAVSSPMFKCALDRRRPVATGDAFGAADEDVETHLDRLPRTLAIARALGTRNVRIFSGWRERAPQEHRTEVIGLLRRASEIARHHQMTLLLENEPACNAGLAGETAEIVRAVDHPSLRLLWDPGNEAHAGGRAFPDGYRQVAGLVAHVHIKDAAPHVDGKPRWRAVGDGHADIAEQIRALEADGYRGLYVLETHYVPDGGTKREGSEASLAGLRRIVERLASGGA